MSNYKLRIIFTILFLNKRTNSMKKLLFLFALLTFTSLFAQSKYSISFEPVALFNQDGDIETFGLYNLQFSYINMQGKSFFIEIQTGVLLDGFTPHLNLYLGGDFTHFFIKAGVTKFFNIAPGQASGPDFGNIFLPSIVTGVYIYKTVFIDTNFMLGILSFGMGYQF